jgi:hypothetical protein
VVPILWPAYTVKPELTNNNYNRHHFGVPILGFITWSYLWTTATCQQRPQIRVRGWSLYTGLTVQVKLKCWQITWNNNNLEYDDIKEYVWKYWDAHRPVTMAIDDSPFQVSKKGNNQQPSSNAVFNKRKPCEYCSKHRKDLSRTHGTKYYIISLKFS